jgi:hypothetical protein
VNSERVHAAGKLAGKRRVDHAMAFEPALSAEGFRHDIESEMALAALPMSGMAFVQVGFILDMQAFGREGRDQLCRDDVLHRHAEALAMAKH